MAILIPTISLINPIAIEFLIFLTPTQPKYKVMTYNVVSVLP